MKLYGLLEKLTRIIFKEDGQDISLDANQSTTYTAARLVELPPGDTAHVLVSATSTQTLTGKTIDGDDNTVQDLPVTALKTNLTDASKFFVRDASGVPTSATKAVPAGDVVGTTDSQTLTNKTLGSTNTLTGATASSFTNTGTISLPSSTDTLVGRATTDTLTNKTLTSPVISTISNTGTLTLPTSTDTLVGRATTDTLTNKTLTSPTINTSISGTALETDLSASASSSKVPTAAAAKAYADGVAAGGSYVNKSANYTVTTSDGYKVIGVTTSTSTITITLPAAASSTNRILTIKKEDSATGKVVVDGNASETIDGATTITLPFENDALNIVCTGSGWESLDKHRVSDGTNNIPGAGMVGEVQEFSNNNVTVSGTVNLHTFNLDRGSWEVTGWGTINQSGTTQNDCLDISISPTSATHVDAYNKQGHGAIVGFGASRMGQAVVTKRVDVAADATTYYLVANLNQAGATNSGYAYVRAVRVG